MIDLYPKRCNICGGMVVYVSNDKIYGRRYGSGYCYLCKSCGAHVGTHSSNRYQALGILADARMRKGKILCHDLFDKLWKGKRRASKKREGLYYWLSVQMNIDFDDCHFGYFTLKQLRQAYKILLAVQDKTMLHDKQGLIYFE